MVAIELVAGDLLDQRVDVLVNAANSSLLGGGGVDGAIHRDGGPQILAECQALRVSRYRDGLPVGEAVATTAGLLRARWVVHTVGPRFSPAEDRSALLADCHRNSLAVATELGAETIAFPAIGTGIYGWPYAAAAPVALRAVLDADPGSITLVRFVLRGNEAYRAFRAAADDLGVG
ncbi:MAG TPA: O-acetyl-ADP-ribose deacetylase [Pseudonocardiaceae bacterium]|jgi:O-acetyl-ADP-ribose deacetylase (regulator of RNase III)